MKRTIVLFICMLICSGCIENSFKIETEEINNGYIASLHQENRGKFISYGTNEYDAIYNAINDWVKRDKRRQGLLASKEANLLEKQE